MGSACGMPAGRRQLVAPWACLSSMPTWTSSLLAPSRSSPPIRAESRKLYLDALGLPLAAGEGSDYWHTEQLPGTKHFAIWPLREAAQACFGQPTWPDDRPVPQASIEFEVGDPPAVGAAAEELQERGFVLLHGAREEPWGQIVARLLSPEGLIVGVSYAPGLRDQDESTGA